MPNMTGSMRVFFDRQNQILFWCVACLVPLVLLGCRPGYQRDTAPVRGRVTVDGRPVTSGFVVVIPSSGRMAKGIIQSDGTFTMGTYNANDGVQLGKHPVVVHPVPADEEGDSKQRSGPSIPAQYSIASKSGLQIEVMPDGIDDLNLELYSTAKPQ
jgi:hypothetical protein